MDAGELPLFFPRHYVHPTLEQGVFVMKLKTVSGAILLALIALLLCAGCTQPVTPPATPTPTATPVPPAKDIVDTAIADGRFTTLVAAVQAADLVDTLRSPGPFTVFAPTDDAFAILPAGTVDALLAEPKGMLTQILLYHVVPGKLMASDVVGMASLPTAQGNMLKVTVNGSEVMVDGARVIITDIETSNGVIHVIDSVLIPPSVCYDTVGTSPEAPAHSHRWCEGAESTLKFCNDQGVCHTHTINETANLAEPAGLGPHTHNLR